MMKNYTALIMFLSILLTDQAIASDTQAANDVVAQKISDQSLLLTSNGEKSVCKTNFKYGSFRYSSDKQFLMFNLPYDKSIGTTQLGSIDLTIAYAQCKQGLSITIDKLASKYGTILDINKKGDIFVTNIYNPYETGGNTVGIQILATVRKYSNSKEIYFPFSPRKKDNAEQLSSKAFDTSPLDDLEQNSSLKLNVISKNGDYVAPVGGYGSTWSILSKKEVCYNFDSNKIMADSEECKGASY
jgi:hypothetical protein